MQPVPEIDEQEEPALAFLRELWSLNHALERASKRMHATHGVTAQQRMVLRLIGKRPGITARELTDILHVDGGTLSIALKRLEARGLVARRADAGDKRRAMLSLTAKGKRLDTPSSGLVERAINDALASSRAADVRGTRAFLRRVVELLERMR